jgi:teichuronic acid exporter
LVYCTVLFSLFAWSAKDFLAQQLGDVALAPWLVLAPISAWFLSISVGLQQLIQRKQDFRASGYSEVLSKGGYVLSALSGVLWLPQIWGLLISSGFGAAAKAFWLWRRLKISHSSLSNKFESTNTKILQPYAKLAGAMSFSNILGMITTALPMIFIAKIYGANTLGQYGLVISTLYLPAGLIGKAIGQVYLQRASQLYSDGQRIDNLWRSTISKLIKIGIPLYLFVSLASPWAYPFFFGSKWYPAGEYAMLLSLAACLSFITSPLDRTCLIVNAWWYAPIWHSTRALATILVAFLASYYTWSFDSYLIAMTIQTCALYLVDGLSSRFFANQTYYSCTN